MKEKKSSVRTCKNVTNGKVKPAKVVIDEYIPVVTDYKTYDCLEKQFYGNDYVNVLNEIIKITGLSKEHFSYIYGCSIEDITDCLYGTAHCITPKVMQAIIRAWADIRYLNNEFLYWKEDQYLMLTK